MSSQGSARGPLPLISDLSVSSWCLGAQVEGDSFGTQGCGHTAFKDIASRRAPEQGAGGRLGSERGGAGVSPPSTAVPCARKGLAELRECSVCRKPPPGIPSNTSSHGNWPARKSNAERRFPVAAAGGHRCGRTRVITGLCGHPQAQLFPGPVLQPLEHHGWCALCRRQARQAWGVVLM